MVGKTIEVDVVSDVICPWCWVGKKNLDAAITSAADEFDVTVRWHPFFLRPDTPKEGRPKAPDTPDNPRVGARLRAAGARAGIDFTGKTDRTPNTLLAHRALHYAAKADAAASPGGGNKGVQHELQERIFQGYFTDGAFPDLENLSRWVGEVGLDGGKVRAYLASDEDEGAVTREALGHARAGINGVPTFFVNGKMAFSGGQPPDAFLREFRMQ